MNLHISLSGLRATSPRGAAVFFLLSSFLLFSTPLSTNATQGVAAGAAFAQWLASLWPEAPPVGVSPPAFETPTRGAGAGFFLPRPALHGPPEAPQPSQPEFVRTPADYLREATISRLAANGAKLREQYRVVLDRIEQRFGVPGAVVLAIWGRESDFSTRSSGQNAIQVLAT